jgi:hypothetical protein
MTNTNGADEPVPSFKKFDYRVRLNKGTERKMLLEIFRRLVFFEPLENYRYIGFGATTFTDFILLHREFNIIDMISIEKFEEFENRCNFNKPFDCIKIECGSSNDVLPKLTWDKRTIVWFDYDGRLNEAVKQDISFSVARLTSGSMFVVTVNAEGYKSQPNQSAKRATESFRRRFEKSAEFTLPIQYEGKHLQGIEMAKTCQALIEDTISTTLNERNGLSSDNEKMYYLPLTNFVYADGSQMLTIGGLLYQKKDENIVKMCQFDNISFTQPGEKKLYEISIPIITPREKHFLDQQLPTGSWGEAEEKCGLTKDEINNYLLLYRYCPSYGEIGLV